MDLEAVGIAVGTIVLSATSFIAAKKASAADKQTRNTGNGFAGEVLAALAEIKADVRAHREQTTRLERRFDRHLEHHDERNYR